MLNKKIKKYIYYARRWKKKKKRSACNQVDTPHIKDTKRRMRDVAFVAEGLDLELRSVHNL